MDEKTFEKRSEQTLRELENFVETNYPDCEIEETQPFVFSIETTKGLEIVVNRHAPNQEIWIASKQGAHHFHLVMDAWKDTRSDAQLFTFLRQLLT